MLGLIAAAILIRLLLGLGSLGVYVLGGIRGTSERDPMFAEEAEQVTPPPELCATDEPVMNEDRSVTWDTSVQTPVDKTARELMNEP